MTNLWLIKLDKAKPGVNLPRKVFNDVRGFYKTQFKHEIMLVKEDKQRFFYKLKPRIQKDILDQMFENKY